jgi:hypothetical protein
VRRLVEVKAEHIKKGHKRSGTSCPVAIAIVRGCGFHDGVHVDQTGVYDRSAFYKLAVVPRSVKRFIHNFDSNKTVKPFRFYLSLPYLGLP